MAIAPIITSIANVWRGEELAARLEYKIRAVLKAFDLKTAAADSIPMDLARFAKISYVRALIDTLTWVERACPHFLYMRAYLFGYGGWVLPKTRGYLTEAMAFIEFDLDVDTIVKSKMFSF